MRDDRRPGSDRRNKRDVTVTIGADGRVLFHDLPPELLPVAALLCPGDPGLKLRCRAARALEKGRS
jgi:hypothetical protein